jgi:hypothetical protein
MEALRDAARTRQRVTDVIAGAGVSRKTFYTRTCS